MSPPSFRWLQLPGGRLYVAAPHVLQISDTTHQRLRLEIWRNSDEGLSRSNHFSLVLREPVKEVSIQTWGPVYTLKATKALAETLLGPELSLVDAFGQPL